MAIGFKIADGYVEVHAVVDDNEVRNAARQAGMRFGDEVDNEVRRSSRSSGRRGGEEAARGWFGSFVTWLFRPNHTLSRILPGWFEVAASPVTAAGFGLGLIWAVAFASGILTSGALVGVGAGILALGALALKSNKEVAAAWTKTADVVAKAFTRAAEPLIKPFVLAARIIEKSVPLWEPILNRIFKIIGPAVEPLTEALVAFTVNFLGGIEKAAPAIRDVLIAFAEELPDLGTALGNFFVFLAENKDLIIAGLRLIFTWLQILLDVLARFLVFNTDVFVTNAAIWHAIQDTVMAVVHWFQGPFVRGVKSVGDFFVNLWNTVAGFFIELWNDITSSITSGSSSTANFFIGIWNAVAGFFTGLWDGFVRVVQGAWDLINAAFQLGQQLLLGAIGLIVGSARAVWEPFWREFGDLAVATMELIRASTDLFFVLFIGTWKLLVAGVSTIWNGFRLAFTASWNATWEAVRTTATFVWGLLQLTWQATWSAIRGVWDQFWKYFGPFWNQSWNTVKTIFTTIWNGLVVYFRGIWNSLRGSAGDGSNFVRSTISNAWNASLSFTRTIWNNIYKYVVDTLQRQGTAIRNALQSAVDFIRNLWDDFYRAGQRIMEGLIAGVTNKIRAFTDTIRSLAQKARDFLPSSPAKTGPFSGSGAPNLLGRKIPEMLSEGVMAGAPTLQAAMNALLQPVAAPPVPLSAAAPEPAGGGGDTFNITLKGVWDFTDAGSAKRIVGQLYDAIEEYKRGYNK